MSPRNSPDIRLQRLRIERALAWAQKRLGSGYHFMVVPHTRTDPDYVEDADLWINRTERGTADKTYFVIGFNAAQVREISTPSLRIKAGHEVLHAMHWDVAEWAEKVGDADASVVTTITDDIESFIYRIQRVIFGEEK